MKKAAALRDGGGGGSEPTGRRKGGGGSAGRRQPGRVPPPLSRLGRTARDRGRLARNQRKRRRRIQRTAKSSAAILQGGETAAVTRRESATGHVSSSPTLSLHGIPQIGVSSLSPSREHENIKSPNSSFSKHHSLRDSHSSLPYIGERKRGGCPKGSPVIQGVWPKRIG